MSTQFPKIIAPPAEARLIMRIVDRFVEVTGYKGSRLVIEMDVTACHLNGNPLRLEDMLAGSASDLAHDVAGIRSHIDRDTGKLQNCFSPRYSK